MFLTIILASFIFYIISTEVNTLDDMFTTPSPSNEYGYEVGQTSGSNRFDVQEPCDQYFSYYSNDPGYLIRPDYVGLTGDSNYWNTVEEIPNPQIENQSYEQFFGDDSYGKQVKQGSSAAVSTKYSQKIPSQQHGKHKFTRVLGLSAETRSPCDECKRKTGYRKFVNTRCNDCDEYLCARCHKEIHKLASLPTVPTEFDTDQICTFCDKHLGVNKKDLVEHSRTCNKIKRKIGDNWYGCYKCGLNFRGAHFLKKHFKTHIGSLPNTCIQCFIEFTDKESFQAHLKEFHAEVK